MAAMGSSVFIRKHMFRAVLVNKLCARHAMMCAAGGLLLAKGYQISSKAMAGCAPSAEQLKRKFGWIEKHVPCFGVNGDNITVIHEPSDFYQTFKTMLSHAKRRIVIASLYLGTGSLEKELVNCLEDVCARSEAANNGKLEVHILLDHCRGSRGMNQNSRTELCPLLQKYGHRVHVYLYHSPDLRGWLRQCIPQRYNEIIGLNHMKIYMADDDFIISGANLNDTYFTNRQDRYIQFRSCPKLANYLSNIVMAVSRLSFHLQGDNSTVYPANTPHPYEGSEAEYKDFGNELMCSVLAQQSETNADMDGAVNNNENTEVDTWLHPLVQMAPFRIYDDELVTKRLFTESESGDRILMASGYFNLTDDYMEEILSQSKANFDILTSSPETNGFFGSGGITQYVPTTYTLLARQFYERVTQSGQEDRISIFEYYRRNWTYHCKGLWYCLPDSSTPVLSVIGSTNFGYRSVFRDLECQIAILTCNSRLQQQLQEEHQRLFGSSSRVTASTFQQEDRYVPLWVRMVSVIIKQFF